MWENVIGISEAQAGTNEGVEALINAPVHGGGRKAALARRAAAAEAVMATGGFDTAITNYQSLLSLAKTQGAVGGNATRGACRVCGQLGHLSKQCRNQFSKYFDAGAAGEAGSSADALAAAQAALRIEAAEESGLSDSGLSSDSDDSEDERRRCAAPADRSFPALAALRCLAASVADLATPPVRASFADLAPHPKNFHKPQAEAQGEEGEEGEKGEERAGGGVNEERERLPAFPVPPAFFPTHSSTDTGGTACAREDGRLLFSRVLLAEGPTIEQDSFFFVGTPPFLPFHRPFSPLSASHAPTPAMVRPHRAAVTGGGGRGRGARPHAAAMSPLLFAPARPLAHSSRPTACG
jgi:hypothetical protein